MKPWFVPICSVAKALATLFTIAVLHIEAEAATVQACGAEGTKSGQTLRVKGSGIAVHAEPNPKSEKLINQAATQILKSTQYITIDYTVTVVEECKQRGWSKVRVTEPDWLRDSHIGWVPSTALRGQKKDGGGKVEFTDADFGWDKNTLPHKKTIVAGVNKVYRENSRCTTIDPSSAYVASGKGSSTDPAFYVTCGTGAGAFNAFFSKSEVENGKTLRAAKHIDRGRAIDLCESYVKSKTNHPSTFSFSRVMDLAADEHPNGRTSIWSSFTAKNSFNLELKHNVRCIFDSSGLIEANISEAR